MTQHIAYLRAYRKEGHARIWIEGRRVSDAGFEPGGRYAVHFLKDAIELRLTDGIGRKVHGKKKNGGAWPIIDIFNAGIDQALRGAAKLRAEFAKGLIRIVVSRISASAASRAERLLKAGASGAALRTGSLFHGLGVLDNAVHEGLEAEGFQAELAFAVERDAAGLDASLANNGVWSGASTAILADIEDVEASILPKLDLLVAGIPCQGASKAGRTALKLQAPEFHPEVGHLFVPFLKIVEATEAGIVLIENVPDYAKSAGFHAIRKTLENLGYEVELGELAGNDFGALEARRRMVAIARSHGMPPILDRIRPNGLETKLGDVLDALPDDDAAWQEYAHVHTKVAKDGRKPGNGFRLNLLDPASASVPTIIKGYAETKSWQPFLRHPSDPKLMRKFTPAEHARIKGIPEELIRGLPATVAHALLGQSVIHPAFKAVGRAIAGALRASARPAAAGDLFATAA